MLKPVWSCASPAARSRGACREAARDSGADCLILGVEGLAGLAERLQAEVPVTLIDSVSAGAAEALRLAEAAPEPNPTAASPGADTPSWQGLSPELARSLTPSGRA